MATPYRASVFAPTPTPGNTMTWVRGLVAIEATVSSAICGFWGLARYHPTFEQLFLLVAWIGGVFVSVACVVRLLTDLPPSMSRIGRKIAWTIGLALGGFALAVAWLTLYSALTVALMW
ncbi:MAG TPA: hypothetical protein VF407_11575 [Polyangiaceae bacterium]